MRAEEANRAKSRFFAAVNHDLRQPLHALGLFSATLREMSPEPDKRAVVDHMHASIDALESLFDELLDLSGLDAGAGHRQATDDVAGPHAATRIGRRPWHGVSPRVPLGEPGRVQAASESAIASVDVLAGKRIVVVDDELAIRQGMQALLMRWGCVSVTAATGAQAVVLLDECGPPDWIICDHRLAGAETGAGVIDDLRRRYGANIPAMLISADTSPERLRETRAAGHLLQHKPVRPAQLRAACNHLLAKG